jgi:hypothetical protein
MKTAATWLLTVLYLGAPIYYIVWIVQRVTKGRSVTPAVIFLAVWVVASASVAAYFYSGLWYGEGQHHWNLHRIVDLSIAVATAGMFVLFPIGSMLYLRKKARQ